jgi:hypothetical protein
MNKLDNNVVTKGLTVGDIREAIKQSASSEEALKRMHIRVGSDSKRSLTWLIRGVGIDISHWKGKPTPRSHREIFCKDSVVGQTVLVNRYKKKHPPKSCACCGVDFSTLLPNGQKIKATLDHINGVNNDNRYENLRWACPNCHASLPTSNKGSGEKFKGIISRKIPDAVRRFFD